MKVKIGEIATIWQWARPVERHSANLVPKGKALGTRLAFSGSVSQGC